MPRMVGNGFPCLLASSRVSLVPPLSHYLKTEDHGAIAIIPKLSSRRNHFDGVRTRTYGTYHIRFLKFEKMQMSAFVTGNNRRSVLGNRTTRQGCISSKTCDLLPDHQVPHPKS